MSNTLKHAQVKNVLYCSSTSPHGAAVSGVLTPPDISRLEGKMDKIVEKLSDVVDRISRVEERALGALPALDASRLDLIALRMRVELLERVAAETKGQNRMLAILWGIIVALPGILTLWKSTVL